MQPKEVVDVTLFLSEWSHCLTAKYQRDRLYRFGKFDDCGSQWQDFKKAFRAKVTKDEYEVQFADIFDQIIAYAAGAPINVVNPAVLDSKGNRR